MRQIIQVNLHSFVDVITNSSTELFVCDTKKSVEMIKELLQDILSTWCKCNDKEEDFAEVFGEISVIQKDDKKAAKELMGTFGSYKDYHSGALFNTYPDHNNDKYKKEPEKQYSMTDFEKLRKDEEKWIEEHVDEFCKQYAGRVLIYSASDNSIPYELFEMIDGAFNGYHIHLG